MTANLKWLNFVFLALILLLSGSLGTQANGQTNGTQEGIQESTKEDAQDAAQDAALAKSLEIVASVEESLNFGGWGKMLTASIRGLINPQCLNLCVTGVCTYLQCSPVGCRIVTRPHLRHRLPDLVVTAWSGHGHPLFGLKQVLAQWAKLWQISHGGGTRQFFDIGGGSDVSGRRRRFVEADVIGNPFLALLPNVVCKPSGFPLRVHYSSVLDHFLWRSGLTDLYEVGQRYFGDAEQRSNAWIEIFPNGGQSIGNPNHPNHPTKASWGSLLPRIGFISAVSTKKSLAVAALRALDVAEQAGGLHLRLPISQGDLSTGMRAEVVRSDAWESDCWQNVDSPEKGCLSLADSLEAITGGSTSTSWLRWTEYTCCPDGVGQYLGTVPLPSPICL